MKLHATGRDLIIKEAERLISGSINIYTCEFTFDSSWDGYLVTAVFSIANKVVNRAIIDGKCDIPAEVLRPNMRLRIGVFGNDGVHTRPTTYSEWIPVEQGTDTDGKTGKPPELNAYEQWMNHIDGKLDEMEEAEIAREEAEAAREEAEKIRGKSAVYVGSGDCPEGFNIQIDPSGEELVVAAIDDTATSPDTTWSSEKISKEIGTGGAKPAWKAFADCTWEEIAYIARYYDPSEYWKVGDVKRLGFSDEYSVPVVIADFKKYTVADVRSYGKQKAGLVLQLGADRQKNGDAYSGVLEPQKSGLPQGFIDGNGLFKSPNRLAGYDPSTGLVSGKATWWAESAVRDVLQSIFDGTELADLVVPVEVVTSKYCNENNGYENFMVTTDKVFLPSETELYGKQYLSPAIEGEMLEYYRKGASRFFWGNYTLENAASYIGSGGWSIWTRSSAQRRSVGAEANLNNSVQTQNAACRVYNNIISVEPLACGHGYSIAEGAGGYYVPLFCL